MQFYFSYPMSETQSYYLLQDCLVALYFQLYFLLKQCWTTRVYGEGWGYCKYGDGVISDGCGSWICPEAVTKGKEYKKDKETKEKLKQQPDLGILNQQNCGSSAKNPSPLQAFLTDCLKGFTCPVLVDGTSGKKYQENLMELRKDSKANANLYSECYPQFLEHRGHTSKIFGTECALPMGFSGSFRSGGAPAPGAGGSGSGSAAAGQGNGMIGLGIHSVIATYASTDMSSASLYQITRCICSLTRRVPRSTGTIFGFFYGLVDVYSGDRGGFKNALEGELKSCPGYREPSCLLDAIKEWRGVTHNDDHKKGSLDSLYNNGDQCDTCGKYLQTLSGSLYKSVAPQFTATYLSWIIHLTWILHKGLESFLEAFKDISCEDCGCSKKDDCKSGECKKGTHGEKCCCDNVVVCAGVHGLFYRFGFSYTNTGFLSGKKKVNALRADPQFHLYHPVAIRCVHHWHLVDSAGVSAVVNDCESGSDAYPVALEKP
ncbi:variant erythrocyte surface antigen alpha subunit, putative [Babesia ovis]|uniref:Variant erythrocyte surface antigen alpha subunit, putative n=1 Tax=Babesia ovis TaxID=5869 RepID=A0A9W5TEY0_BABOV|nr:variant erythrocyte surface antigen alpha subunit, putative [Babesia ovis]